MARRGTSWLWSGTALMALAVVAIWVVAVRSAPIYDGSFHVPWWMLAALFALAEINVLHVQLDRETQTFSLNELPLVLGLFFSSPVELVAGQALGVGLALVLYRRQPLLKWTFNLAQFTLTTLVAIAVFRLIAVPGGLLPAIEIGAAFAAATAAILLGTLAVILAISVTEGRPALGVVLRNAGFGVAGTLTTTGLALLGVLLLRDSPASVWLLAMPVALLFLAYRGYTKYRLQNERLAALSAATRDVERSVSFEPAMTGVLQGAKDMLRGELAWIRFLGDKPGDPVLEVQLGPDGDVGMGYVDLDPHEGVWARVVSEGQGVLLARPISNQRLREHFATRGIHDAVVVPLWGRDGVSGTMLVGNRTGDVETFTHESLALLETFANHVGVALENVRLMTKLQFVVDDLTETGRRKDESLANVAHDMRNPLTSLMAFIHLLLDDDDLSPSDLARFTRMMSAQAEHIRVLIDELVMHAQVEERAPRRVSPIEPAALAEEVLQTVAAATSDHHLEVAIDRTLTTFDADRVAMGRILGNLLTNACRNSPTGSTVILASRHGDGGIVFSVVDEGVGIPQEMHEQIFERFFQGDGADRAGSGLGLAISKRLAEDLGGRLWLERSAPGAGSEFRLWIPTTTSMEHPTSGVNQAVERAG